MTRKEQIANAARKFWIVEDNICEAATFQKGAEWADENPPFYDYPEYTPKNIGHYLVIDFDCELLYKLAYWNGSEWCDSYHKHELQHVVSWMELPKLNK